MKELIHKLGRRVSSVLNGFDRIRFRGTRRQWCNVRGMASYLLWAGIRCKDFTGHFRHKTDLLRAATRELAARHGQEVRYLPSSQDSKEDLARKLAAANGIREGLIGIFSCVEPTYSFKITRDARAKELRLEYLPTKCLHYYHYYMHPQLGFCHVRLQTWLPYNVHICINGREWLARQMDQAGLAYRRRGNCFVDLQDAAAAQALMDRQLQTDWASLLGSLLEQANPVEQELAGDHPVPYYWSADESEWASDLLFRSRRDLAGLYPRLVQQAITGFSSGNVLRFLGQRVKEDGTPCSYCDREVQSHLAERPEGVRVKHKVNNNSVKMYDKQGLILRIETTINQPRDLRTYRRPEGQPQAPRKWLPLRKGVADMHRRAEISQGCNNRYAQALAAVPDDKTVQQVLEPLTRRVSYRGRKVRGLRPLDPQDSRLLEIIARGEFHLAGFRNSDLREALYGNDPRDVATRSKRSAAVSRHLRLLRAHGLIQKISGRHLYRLTDKGRQATQVLLLARRTDSSKLTA